MWAHARRRLGTTHQQLRGTREHMGRAGQAGQAWPNEAGPRRAFQTGGAAASWRSASSVRFGAAAAEPPAKAAPMCGAAADHDSGACSSSAVMPAMSCSSSVIAESTCACIASRSASMYCSTRRSASSISASSRATDSSTSSTAFALACASCAAARCPATSASLALAASAASIPSHSAGGGESAAGTLLDGGTKRLNSSLLNSSRAGRAGCAAVALLRGYGPYGLSPAGGTPGGMPSGGRARADAGAGAAWGSAGWR
eukprot:scaffold19525_cov69-Phaeocystis_antarctica.AAC.1